MEIKINNKLFEVRFSDNARIKNIEVYEIDDKKGLSLHSYFTVTKGHPKENPYYYFNVLHEDVKIYLRDIERYNEKSFLVEVYKKTTHHKGDNYLMNFMNELKEKMQIIDVCRI